MSKVNKQTTTEKVEELVKFYTEHEKLDAQFVLPQFANADTNLYTRDGVQIKDNTSTIAFMPDIKLEIDGEYKHIAYFNGEDVLKVVDKYTDKVTGKFERPQTMESIPVKGGKIFIKADSLQNKQLIRYFLYLSFCSKLVEYVEHTASKQQLGSTERFKIAKLFELMFETEAGYEYISALLKDSSINPQHELTEALESKGDKETIKNILMNIVITGEAKVVSKLLPSSNSIATVEKVLKSELAAYNKDTSSFQLKTSGKFVKDQLLFTVNENNETIQGILFAKAIDDSPELKARLQSIMDEVK